MTSKKLKKTFTAAFLSGSILLQNFPALAAASDTTDWAEGIAVPPGYNNRKKYSDRIRSVRNRNGIP